MKFKNKSAVIYLVLLNVVFFLLQIFLGRNFTNSLLLVSSDVFTRPWILLTSMFLHGGSFHLLFNMYVLFMFGPLLEQRIGAKRFLFIYLLSGLVAGFLSSFFYPRSLGASGAIMGILGVVIILMPDLRVLLFFVIPMSLLQASILIAIIEIFGIFVPSGIANVAHLVGMGCGLLYGLHLKKYRRNFQKRFSSKKHLDSDDMQEYFKTGRI